MLVPWNQSLSEYILDDLQYICFLLSRQKEALDDDAAMELGHHFESPDLMKNVARARRRAIGAMFPTSIH